MMGSIEEIKKEQIVSTRSDAEHKLKMEREEARHRNIMEEIAAMKKAQITVYARR